MALLSRGLFDPAARGYSLGLGVSCRDSTCQERIGISASHRKDQISHYSEKVL